MEQMTPQEARQVLIGAQQGAKLPPAQVSEKRSVNGQAIKLKIVKPENATGTLPAFMFFHGGGWVLGDFPTHERLIRIWFARQVPQRFTLITRRHLRPISRWPFIRPLKRQNG